MRRLVTSDRRPHVSEEITVDLYRMLLVKDLCGLLPDSIEFWISRSLCILELNYVVVVVYCSS